MASVTPPSTIGYTSVSALYLLLFTILTAIALNRVIPPAILQPSRSKHSMKYIDRLKALHNGVSTEELDRRLNGEAAARFLKSIAIGLGVAEEDVEDPQVWIEPSACRGYGDRASMYLTVPEVGRVDLIVEMTDAMEGGARLKVRDLFCEEALFVPLKLVADRATIEAPFGFQVDPDHRDAFESDLANLLFGEK